MLGHVVHVNESASDLQLMCQQPLHSTGCINLCLSIATCSYLLQQFPFPGMRYPQRSVFTLTEPSHAEGYRYPITSTGCNTERAGTALQSGMAIVDIKSGWARESDQLKPRRQDSFFMECYWPLHLIHYKTTAHTFLVRSRFSLIFSLIFFLLISTRYCSG